MESLFSEIRITHQDEKGRYHVDAYKTSDPNEEGRVLAEIDMATRKVHWREDTIAKERVDPKVIEALFNFM